jgi:hypothetical protein
LDFSPADANARNDWGINVKNYCAMMLILILTPSVAKADGGVVRARETQGSLLITIFTPPEISHDSPTDVTVMVQKAGEVMMDAEVTLSFVPHAGAEIQPGTLSCSSHGGRLSSIQATRDQAANKLLYGASVVLPATGDWNLQALIRQGGEEVSVCCVLPVGMPARRLAGLWPYLALPLFVIGLFALNQWLRRQSVEYR